MQEERETDSREEETVDETPMDDAGEATDPAAGDASSVADDNETGPDSSEPGTAEEDSTSASDSVGDEADESADENADEAATAPEEHEIPELKQIIEGAIVAADKPLSIDNMISLFEADRQPSRKQVRAVLEEIDTDFADRGFELKQVASGYRFQVRERYSDWIGRLWEEKPPRYTRALLETLALIAYKQPITRGDVEDIRGVAVSTNIIRTLLEREWIRVVGHRDVPGKPAIYATTKNFLDYFNLSSLEELPTLSEIKDLEGANEELELEEEIVEPRTLDIESGEGAEDAEAARQAQEDADLDEVTSQVDTISENIRNLFAEPEEADAEAEDFDPEDSASDDAPAGDVVPEATETDGDVTGAAHDAPDDDRASTDAGDETSGEAGTTSADATDESEDPDPPQT